MAESYLDHTEPSLAQVLDALDGPAVVVPLLLGAAYHSRVDIPRAIEAAGSRRDVNVVQAHVLGPDALLLSALEHRLTDAGVDPGDPGTALVLAAAGSTDEAAVDGVRALAVSWRERGWWAVEPAYASAATPTVADAVAALRDRGAPRIAVATYLLFPGLFADQLAGTGADVTSAPLGDAPEVVRLVLDRYDAAVERTVRLGATDSRKARW